MNYNMYYNNPCSYDYLEIANENNVAIGKYCGWHSGNNISIGGNEAILTFHSDNYNEAKGFLLYFTPVQLGKCKYSLL